MFKNSSVQGSQDFERFNDEELIEMVHQGNIDALDFLITKYRLLARAKAKSYFLIGADKEDIVQEGMIGLYKAIRDFKGDKLSSFRAFAELCITRQIITAIKTATRQKHIPLNRSISLSIPINKSSDEEDEGITLMDIIKNNVSPSPEEEVISKENVEDINEYIIKALSNLEIQVLHLYIDGKNYKEIAKVLDKTPKSIDNALQRIKKKLEGVYK